LFLNQELCKQYLAGHLTPKENYRIENILLENDFGYDAIEGLAQAYDSQWHKHLEETESRISKDFGIRENKGKNLKLALGLTGLVIIAMTTWFLSTNQETLNLTSKQTQETAKPSEPSPIEEALPIETLPIEAMEGTEPSDPNPVVEEQSLTNPEKLSSNQEPATVKSKAKETLEPATSLSGPIETHITVGRIVDTKGIPVVEASVSYGNSADTTDKSGYYALKVSKRGINVKVTHLSTPYTVEIDSHQNWEIVLDIVEQKVIDYYPINAANRFK
jgi:hypothetical protein